MPRTFPSSTKGWGQKRRESGAQWGAIKRAVQNHNVDRVTVYRWLAAGRLITDATGELVMVGAENTTPKGSDFNAWLSSGQKQAMKAAMAKLHVARSELHETYCHPEKARQHTNVAYDAIADAQDLLARWAP